MSGRRQHWDTIFAKSEDDSRLGWYERNSDQILGYLERLDLAIPSTIVLAGAGTSMLPGDLLLRGHRLIINDVSELALDTLKRRIGPNSRASWINTDLGRPVTAALPPLDLWIDRAVLHFLVEDADRRQYFSTLQEAVRPGGYVLLAQFSKEAADKCAGLPVHRYSEEEMSDNLGADYLLIEHEIFHYTTPSGAPRPYLYALFERQCAP